MNSKVRYIPLVIIGAILLSLLAVIPAFSAQGDTAFIDPDDTDETLDWTRQGGTFMVEVDDDDLDVPVKHVLFPADLSMQSGIAVAITANSSMIELEGSGNFLSSIAEGVTVLVADETVRKVVSVSAADNSATPAVRAMIEVNAPFSTSATGKTLSLVTNSAGSYDNCSTCARAESVALSNVNNNTLLKLTNVPIVDSGVGAAKGTVPAPANRLDGAENTLLGSEDVLVVLETDPGDPLNVFDVTGSGTVTLNEEATGDLLVAYWGSVQNDTGTTVNVSSTADPRGINVVLKETGPNTGIFRLEVKAGDNDDAVSDATLTPPVLKVGASDTVRLTYDDADPDRTDRDTLSVESIEPTFTIVGPDDGTRGKESRPDIVAQISDGAGSGVDEDSIRVVFARAEEGSSNITETENRSPATDGRSRVLPGDSGYRITQSASSDLVGSEDATVYWWVIGTDTAGNVAVLDSADTIEVDGDDQDDPCRPNDFVSQLASLNSADVSNTDDISGCQPYSYSIDFTEPVLTEAVTGSHWDASSDDDDKTVTDPADADNTSIRVDFSEDLDSDSVDASDFLVKIDEDDNGRAPSDAVVYAGRGNSVFLTVSALDPDAQPTVVVVDEIMDIAGNALEDDERLVVDRIAPSLEVTVTGTGSEGGRPVTDEEIVVSISVNEAVATPKVSVYRVTQTGVLTDDDDDTDEMLTSVEENKNAVLKSDGNYEFKFKSSSAGLYSVTVSAGDANENNQGKAGDSVLPISLDDDTSALLFEVDTAVAAPAITPEETDNSSPFVTLDYSDEGKEYAEDEDLDSHGKVTIMSATFNGEDITDALVTSDMVKYLYKASDLGPGEYDVEVTAKDEAGNELESEGTVEIVERDPYSISLAPGWNLVSIPAEPADGDINSVIPADHPARSVLSYDPSIPGAWLTATRSNGGGFEGTLTEITSGRAYWIHTTSFESIKVDIPRLNAGSPVAPPTINIVKGWNMVPVQDVDEDREDVSAKSYFSGLDVSRVYWFDTVGNTWTSIDVGSVDDDGNATDMLQVGKGYWVFTTEEGTLAP